MKTMTTVQEVERTPSGAFKVTLLGGVIAGTLDAEIGQFVTEIAGSNDPAEFWIEDIGQGKLEIKGVKPVEAPEELGGPADEAQAAPIGQTDAAPADEPTLDAVIVKGLEAFSDEALLAEVARRLAS